MQLLLNALADALETAANQSGHVGRMASHGTISALRSATPDRVPTAYDADGYAAFWESHKLTREAIAAHVPAIPTAPLPPFSAEELATILLGLSVLQQIDCIPVKTPEETRFVERLFNGADDDLLSAYALSADEIDDLHKRLTTEA